MESLSGEEVLYGVAKFLTLLIPGVWGLIGDSYTALDLAGEAYDDKFLLFFISERDLRDCSSSAIL